MFGKEPAVIIGLITAGIALAVGFGLNVTPEQTGLIIAFVAAVLSFVTRSQVTPTSKPKPIAGGSGVFVPKKSRARFEKLFFEDRGAVGVAFVLFLAALVCFLLALFSVKVGTLDLVVLGLSFVAGGLLAQAAGY